MVEVGHLMFGDVVAAVINDLGRGGEAAADRTVGEERPVGAARELRS